MEPVEQVLGSRVRRRAEHLDAGPCGQRGCHSWYLGPDGVPELRPWSPAVHRSMMRNPVSSDFEVLGGAGGSRAETS